MDQTVQRCSHPLHSAAKLECRSHCPVAPVVPLLVAIATVDRGQYIYTIYWNSNGKKRKKERRKEMCVRARLERLEANELTSRYFAR